MTKIACLTAIKGYINETEFDTLSRAIDEGDQKTWDFFMQGQLDKMARNKEIAVRKVAIEGTFVRGITEVMEGDKHLAKLTAQLSEEMTPKAKQKLVKKMFDHRTTLTNDYLNALWDDAGFAGRFNITSTYKDGLAIYQGLISEMEEGININPGAYGRTVRVMTEVHKMDLLRSVWGDTTNTKGAMQIATGFARAIKYANSLVRRAGGIVHDIQPYRLTNTYDISKMMKAGKVEYIKDHAAVTDFVFRDNPDLVGKIDPNTGEKYYLPSENRERFLGDQFDNIVAGRGEGMPGITMDAPRDPMLANQKPNFRYINATTAENWYKSATKYGKTNNPLEVMNTTLQGLSHKINMLEKWGPNPPEMWQRLLGGLRKSFGNQNIGNKADSMFKSMVPAPRDSTDLVVNLLQGARKFSSQHLLGSATLAAMADVPFSSIDAFRYGMSPINVFTKHMGGMLPGSDLIERAQTVGIISHEALKIAGQDHRMIDAGSNGILGRMVNFMLKGSLLSRWTNAGKAAFGMEFLHQTAKLIQSGKVSPNLANVFDRFGISVKELMELKGSIITYGGMPFVKPSSLDVEDIALADIKKRLLSMTIELTHGAVPEPGLKVTNTLHFGTKPGTKPNEVIKVLTQYMSFPATVAIRSMDRMMDKSVPRSSRLGYAAGMFVTSSMVGGMIVQAKELSKGNAMMDVNSLEFYRKSILQGGSFGYITDAIFSTNPLLGSPTERKIEMLKKFLVSTATREESMLDLKAWYRDIVGPALYTAELATGFANNLWWTKAAYHRGIKTFIHREINPNFDSDVKDLESYLKKTNPTNKPWWRPGSTMPEFMK